MAKAVLAGIAAMVVKRVMGPSQTAWRGEAILHELRALPNRY
jgi:hypothetical protein